MNMDVELGLLNRDARHAGGGGGGTNGLTRTVWLCEIKTRKTKG